MLNIIEEGNLPDTLFKVMVIRMLKEVSENYKELYGSCKELSRNYISIKRDIEILNKNQ